MSPRTSSPAPPSPVPAPPAAIPDIASFLEQCKRRIECASDVLLCLHNAGSLSLGTQLQQLRELSQGATHRSLTALPLEDAVSAELGSLVASSSAVAQLSSLVKSAFETLHYAAIERTNENNLAEYLASHRPLVWAPVWEVRHANDEFAKKESELERLFGLSEELLSQLTELAKNFEHKKLSLERGKSESEEAYKRISSMVEELLNKESEKEEDKLALDIAKAKTAISEKQAQLAELEEQCAMHEPPLLVELNELRLREQQCERFATELAAKFERHQKHEAAVLRRNPFVQQIGGRVAEAKNVLMHVTGLREKITEPGQFDLLVDKHQISSLNRDSNHVTVSNEDAGNALKGGSQYTRVDINIDAVRDRDSGVYPLEEALHSIANL